MKNTIIEMAMQSLISAERLAETALYAVLAPYGDDGLELKSHSDHNSVYGEFETNVFTKIAKVRSYQSESLQMYAEGKGWVILACADYVSLLEEVQNAIKEKGDE